MPDKFDLLGTAGAIAKGLGVTFREMLSPTVTDAYPDEPPNFEERYRGVHVWNRTEKVRNPQTGNKVSKDRPREQGMRSQSCPLHPTSAAGPPISR